MTPDPNVLGAPPLPPIKPAADETRRFSWDGLADEAGPIPSFGPAQTDGQGRLVMDDREKTERRDATIRTLAVLGRITDPTDSDEVWSQLDSRFGGAS